MFHVHLKRMYILLLWGEMVCIYKLSPFDHGQGVKLIFTGGHITLVVAFKGPNVILGLYKWNYSLTRDKELGAATG